MGSASASAPVTLTSSCTLPVTVTCPGFATDAYFVAVSATGDFTSTDNCVSPLGPSLTVLAAACTINVTFRPSAEGPRTGTLNTGTIDITGLIAGPTVSLGGTGTVPGSGPGTAGPSGTTSKSNAQRRRCKKKRRHHRSAHSAKRKCKKKRR